MVYFCGMDARLNIVTLIAFLLLGSATAYAQSPQKPRALHEKPKKVHLTSMTIYQGDTIPYVKLPTVYIFKPLVFKNRRERMRYNKLVRDVKKVLPLANEVNRAIIETYEYLMTLPDDKARQRHLKAVEKSIK